jgi:hypothetical protein
MHGAWVRIPASRETAPEQLREVFELSTLAISMFESAGEDDIAALGASCLLSRGCPLAVAAYLLRDGALVRRGSPPTAPVPTTAPWPPGGWRCRAATAS